MQTFIDYKYLNDDIPESEKLEKEYLISNINKHIADLFVENKTFERKCFDFASGIRDNHEMKYLADNYGVSNPLDIPFVPITRKRINYLVNKSLQNKLDYHVTCQNREALEYKLQQKKKEILDDLASRLEKEYSRNAKLIQKGKEPKEILVEELMNDLKAKYDDSWLSDIEIAAYNYSRYYIDRYELKHKFSTAIEHMIITGQCYYRTYINEIGKDPVFEIVSPEELFVDTNNNEHWIKNHRRVVRVKYMTPVDVINQLGHFMTDEEKALVQKIIVHGTFASNKNPHLVNMSDGSVLDYKFTLYGANNDLVRVFHVEWIANNPVEYDTENMVLIDTLDSNIRNIRHRKDRYEGYKIDIGQGIYIGCGKTKYVNRSLMNPFDCELSYNGFRYRYRNGEPYSIVWKSRDIQNMYDLTYFQLNTLFLSIIPGGPLTIEESIPKSYGNTPEERFLKTLGYRKLGYGQLVQLSQEGSEVLGSFNNWGAYIPSNVDPNLIQSLQAQLELLEQQLDNLMGITRQSLGEMEERDGKGTTQMAISMAEIVNKDLYFFHSLFIKHALTSIVNLARISHQEGFLGSYSLGLDHKIFSIDSEKFTMADYNIFFSDEQEDAEKMKLADEFIVKAMESQLIDLRKSFDALMEKSTSYKKRVITRATRDIERQKAEALQQLQQQLEQMQKQLEQLQKENEKLKQVKNNFEEIELKKQELEHKREIEKKKLELEETKHYDMKNLKEKELQIEYHQLTDNNPYNNEIRNVTK